ncbi:Sodium channel protein type 5 subunit alpha (Sodium channel protein cardiac muscle subunit alpha) (Sodium channel protein type V subunit alpha) (Voltage-gated sodium channel subunit alpha Nav1.5) (hH1) [Durusdinium trenchii]|uniref:EF-hand domain-containing protein n=1 Tax=Durusdinium trenchii TaxID=1381693 RepID=A0ABP0R4J1_9DINO
MDREARVQFREDDGGPAGYRKLEVLETRDLGRSRFDRVPDARSTFGEDPELHRSQSEVAIQAISVEIEEIRCVCSHDVDRAFQARKSPLEEELWLTQGRIHAAEPKDGAGVQVWCCIALPWGPLGGELDKEMDLWKLEHGDDTVILVNLIIMFLQMKNDAEQDKLLGDWSIYVDVAFLTFYCFELIVKGCCYESSLLFGHCSVVWWNWLDLVIVMSGLLETRIAGAGDAFVGVWELSDPSQWTAGIETLGGWRMLRLARIARGLKLLRFLVQSDLSWTQHPAFVCRVPRRRSREWWAYGPDGSGVSFRKSGDLTGKVIVLNAIVMWLELDYPLPVWKWVEEFFLVVYVFELSVRLLYYGCGYFVHENWTWHYLDFVIVLFGVAEQWMLPLWHVIYHTLFGATSSTSISMSLVRSLRIVRVFRVLRLARLLRGVKQLYKLIHGVVESMASVGWVIILTFILLYSASLVFTTLVGRGYIYEDPEDVPDEAMLYFGTVWRSLGGQRGEGGFDPVRLPEVTGSFLALFKLMNDDQSVVTQIITTIGGQILFYAFMMLSNWMMLAILTSVISDNMMTVSRTKEEEDRKRSMQDRAEMAKRRITQIFQRLDEDHSGSITEDEMRQWLGALYPYIQVEKGTEENGLHCASYKSKEEGSVILYKQFLTMLQDESAHAKERSIFKVLENMRAMEFRLEERMNAALRQLKMNDEQIEKLPSLGDELKKSLG